MCCNIENDIGETLNALGCSLLRLTPGFFLIRYLRIKEDYNSISVGSIRFPQVNEFFIFFKLEGIYHRY